MAYIKDRYVLSFNGSDVGSYYLFSNGVHSFVPYYWLEEDQKKALAELGLDKEIERKRGIAGVAELMKPENRVPGIKGAVFVNGPFTLARIPVETGERFMVYRCRAEKGDPDYSEKDHSAPHWEGPKTPEGMREWCTWYAFEKMDDGTYQAELDESWWWGGGHNDGGTIRTPIPEEWHSLSYDEFLENVVSLSSAAHYNFTPDDLKAREGLREFFGFKEN